jgi:glycosyltransferase involved in cell wall biosynthesis
MVILQAIAPAWVGGLERVVQTLALGLCERGHEVHIAVVLEGSPGTPHPFLDALAGSPARVHEVRAGNRAYLRERAIIGELCRQHRPVVVHTHGYRPDVIAASAARRQGIPTVTTVHGFIAGGWRNRMYERVQRRAFRSFDAVVAVSRRLSVEVANDGVKAECLRFIQNAWPGEPVRVAKSAARNRLGIENGAFQIGWVGRLSREKGADVLLDALRPLSDASIEVNFVGDGPDRGPLQTSLQNRPVGNRVRWLGNQPAADTMFGAFDVFVLSSRTEGTPMVLFEAMAAGVPIVATRVGGVPYVVDESCALLVPPENPEALAAAIRRIRAEPAAATERAARARDRLTQRFGRDEWIGRYEALYHELCSR